MSYVIPIVMIVISNTAYNLCTKGMPAEADPFAALLLTYGTASVVSFICLLFTSHGKGLAMQFQAVNWVSIALGVTLVVLELGYILAFRAGWDISICSLVANISLAIVLLFVGMLFFKEQITQNQLIGIALCIVGLFFVNKH